MRAAREISDLAYALSGEAHGSSIGDAIGYLLGVPEDETADLVREAGHVIADRLRDDRQATGVLMWALVTGIELGVAAERVARGAAS